MTHTDYFNVVKIIMGRSISILQNGIGINFNKMEYDTFKIVHSYFINSAMFSLRMSVGDSIKNKIEIIRSIKKQNTKLSILQRNRLDEARGKYSD